MSLKTARLASTLTVSSVIYGETTWLITSRLKQSCWIHGKCIVDYCGIFSSVQDTPNDLKQLDTHASFTFFISLALSTFKLNGTYQLWTIRDQKERWESLWWIVTESSIYTLHLGVLTLHLHNKNQWGKGLTNVIISKDCFQFLGVDLCFKGSSHTYDLPKLMRESFLVL